MSTSDLLQQALAAHRAGDVARAEPLYRAVLAADADNATVWPLLGAALSALGRLDESADAFRRATILNPGDVESLVNLGNVLTRRAIGEDATDRAISLDPVEPTTTDDERLPRFQEAADGFRRALALRPGDVRVLNTMGRVLLELGKRADAISLFQEAIRRRPDYVRAWRNLADAARDAGDYATSERCCRQALALNPNVAVDHNRLGVALVRQDRPDEALSPLAEALRLRPGYANAHFNRGVALSDLGRPRDALDAFRAAVAAQPDYALARMSLGMTALLLGDRDEGWREYEWRWRTPEFAGSRLAGTRWDGTPLDGRTILLRAEQGLGDAIQFVRYVESVKARGGRIVLECHAPLVPLFRRLSEIDVVVPLGATLPPFDVHAPLMSLPLLLGDAPSRIPYLVADPEREAFWRREFAPLTGLKVGVVWQGNPRHRRDRQRSVPLATLAPLARLPGVRLVSLQRGPGVDQMGVSGSEFDLIDIGRRLAEPTFDDLAAALRGLDLLVSCDTAPVHLAGALGVPARLLLPIAPDWRWGLDRDDSPWYPTVRLVRQQRRGDWGDVLARLADDLANLVR